MLLKILILAIIGTVSANNLRSGTAKIATAGKMTRMDEVRAQIDALAMPQTAVTEAHITTLKKKLSDIKAAILTEQEDAELEAEEKCLRTHSSSQVGISHSPANAAPTLTTTPAPGGYTALTISKSVITGCRYTSTCVTTSNAANTVLGTSYLFNHWTNLCLSPCFLGTLLFFLTHLCFLGFS